jgi:hypothetical protein
VIPADYKCGDCGAKGVKLWRESHTFADNITLRCAACAEKNQKRTINLAEHDQCGWLVPAVPTLDPAAPWWGYTSVPAEGCAWWGALPLALDGEWKVRGGVMRWMPYRAATDATARDAAALQRIDFHREGGPVALVLVKGGAL